MMMKIQCKQYTRYLSLQLKKMVSSTAVQTMASHIGCVRLWHWGVAGLSLLTLLLCIALWPQRDKPPNPVTAPMDSMPILSAEQVLQQQQLDLIEARLATLQKQLEPTIALEPIDVDGLFNELKTELNHLTQQSYLTHSLDQLQVENQHLTTEISELKGVLHELQAQVAPKAYLDPSLLPFRVESIEFWNERPFVRLTDKSRIADALLGLGEQQGAWRVVEISPTQQMVEFANHKDEHVKVKIS